MSAAPWTDDASLKYEKRQSAELGLSVTETETRTYDPIAVSLPYVATNSILTEKEPALKQPGMCDLPPFSPLFVHNICLLNSLQAPGL